MNSNKRNIDDLDGMRRDIIDNLHGMSKTDLIHWIMELNFDNMSDEDFIEDYRNFYGDIIDE